MATTTTAARPTVNLSQARITQLEQQLAAAEQQRDDLNARLTAMTTQYNKSAEAAWAASDAMARIRLVHDTAEGARSAWRIAREWQENHA